MRIADQPEPSELTGAIGSAVSVEQAEAALVEHYPRLVRLAFITLPPALGRHRRVLAAHATVQRALPRIRTGRSELPTEPRVPAQRGAPATNPGYALVRARVLHDALAHERRPGWWPARLPAPTALRHVLPAVWGLRFFPAAGGADELALEQVLSGADAPTRAALALRRLEGLSDAQTRTLLTEAGVAEAGLSLRTAERLARTAGEETGGGSASLLLSGEFDPCFVHTRPTDLLRRRQRGRAAVAVAAVVALAAVTLPALAGAGDAREDARAPVVAAGPVDRSAAGRALDPARLLRAPAGEWADTSRVDFTSWPARGDRTDDRALLGRALAVWAGPTREVRVSATPDTATAAPAQPPRLLYAGKVDGAAVVLLHDGQRVVRYAEPESGSGAPVLDFARTDDADVTSAAALVVARRAGGARYLMAPWIAESATRDLLKPDTPARGLAVGKDGVTDAVPGPSGGGSCDSWPVLQLRSSELIVEKHAFLVTDLGDLAPVHLTYTPPPGSGAPARQPREATGGPALLSWARGACHLDSLRGSGVRAVNYWVYAQQALPESGGRASWVCTRADTWQGPGRVLVQLQLPGSSRTAPGVRVAEVKNTASCSRFGQHVLAGTNWKAKSGDWYLLAAGSRRITRIEATGGVRATAAGPTMAVRAPEGADATLRATLAEGGTLAALR
ncbi:hypothetical protein ABCR94_21920 [Streptomyces sp. 21So2-11]|uniref:hypothetical protein n=1 Tax=Streptomyces sp. 21So2-11 TaxID=3144408 RepID=UPI00321A35AA